MEVFLQTGLGGFVVVAREAVERPADRQVQAALARSLVDLHRCTELLASLRRW